jgi:hypothetical protein
MLGESIVQTGGQASPLTLDYYRNKVIEFQNILYQMDAAAIVARDIIDTDYDQNLSNEMSVFLQEFDAKKGQFKMAAEALNFAINGVNYAGANFPEIKIPSGLGFIPMAAAAGVAAALAAAAVLITWGRDWIAGLNERLKLEVQLGAITDPDKRAQIVQESMKLEAAQKAADASPLTNVAGIVKYVAIAAVAYFVFQAYQKSR